MPRSGTTLLGGLLASTNRVGRAGEWFNPVREPRGARQDYARYVERVVRIRSVGGVLGVKFLHNQLWSFLETMRSSAAEETLLGRELLEQLFPDPRFIWVERRDVVAQAVSWWRAQKTDDWWLPASAKRKPTADIPTFDLDEIHSVVTEIERGNQRWQRWFATNEIDPHVVVYENLVGDQVEVARRALEFLEIEVPAGIDLKPRTAKQGDHLNAEWIARYRRMSAGRTEPLS